MAADYRSLQRRVIDDETAPSISDFSVDKTVDDDVRTRLNCQTADKVSPNVQGAVFLNNRIGEDRTINIRGATDDQWLWNVALVGGRHHDSRRHCQALPTTPLLPKN